MTESLTDISPKKVITNLIGSEYSFASWRLPHRENRQLIVCLNEVKLTDQRLAEMSSGFLINAFEDNHPPKPFHIKADLIFSENEPRISSTVSSSLIDIFLTQLLKESNNLTRVIQPKLSGSEHNSFKLQVEKAVEEIKAGHFEKVVLSRFDEVDLNSIFDINDFFDRVCKVNPSAFCSLVYIPGRGVWVGATPELLISQNEMVFKTVSLAGTAKLESEDLLSQVAWTQKEIEEQALVSRYIVNCFKKIRLREFQEHGPKTVKAGNLAHLKTDYLVNIGDTKIDDLADQMLKLLHPTSAVCGMPLDSARKFIKETENYNREFYAGFLGPVNFDQSTDLFVNLRTLKIENGKARLFAGAGITENSIPEKELLETDLKIAILNNLLN